MISFGQYVIDFNKNLLYNETLLEGIAVLNPYHNNTETMKVMQAFYYKYNSVRKFLIGINTSRHGDGVIIFRLHMPNLVYLKVSFVFNIPYKLLVQKILKIRTLSCPTFYCRRSNIYMLS